MKHSLPEGLTPEQLRELIKAHLKDAPEPITATKRGSLYIVHSKVLGDVTMGEIAFNKLCDAITKYQPAPGES